VLLSCAGYSRRPSRSRRARSGPGPVPGANRALVARQVRRVPRGACGQTTATCMRAC